MQIRGSLLCVFGSFSPRRFAAATLLVVLLFCVLAQSQDPIEIVRIESDLVDLKVSVLAVSPKLKAPLLEKKDFTVLEDGMAQEISFFAAADTPFDLVLLLDLSGSNSKKLKMIRSSAKRFVDSARSVDRIALVAFTDRSSLLSPFSLDRGQLKKRIDEIDEAMGGTNFWDSLDYVLRDLVPKGQGLRRSAVVVMTDGIDNALPDVPGPGSRVTFDQLLSRIRDSEAIVFPIYLDNEEENVKRYRIPRAAYAQARADLTQIASSCGTFMYRAAKLKDLDQVYSRVIADLSTVYTISYRPLNRRVDGKWRSVEVQLSQRADLLARTKRGYYARAKSER